MNAVRRIGGVVAVAALAVGISLAQRAAHPAVVRFCCAYSPERLAAGAWWTVFGSALLVVRLKMFGINTALLVGVVSPYALRQGSRRALTVFFAGHVAATLAVAAVVLPLAAAGWHPAEVVRVQMDVGASAGVAAVAGAMAVSARRRRLGVALFAGLAVFFAAHLVAAHTLSEAEHLIALTTGALLARRWEMRERQVCAPGVPSSTVHGGGGTLDPVVGWPTRGDGSR
ncbi:MAG: rhomboid family intramembrane serine protease [Actinobacteria bacterium]|nr:rhomboid family intramembrane serine protease [Actinomycetota bacterium]